MKRKGFGDEGPRPTMDPLVWLKSELQKESPGGALDADMIRELDGLVESLAKEEPLGARGIDHRALEVLAEMLPSESLTDEFIENMIQERKARSALTSPGLAVRSLRLKAELSLGQAAECLGTTTSQLDSIERESMAWFRLPPERLPRLAALAGMPWESVLATMRFTARRWLLGQVEARLQVALGRYDKLQKGSQRRVDAIKTAFAMVVDENREAADFFRRAQLASQTGGFRASGSDPK